MKRQRIVETVEYTATLVVVHREDGCAWSCVKDGSCDHTTCDPFAQRAPEV